MNKEGYGRRRLSVANLQLSSRSLRFSQDAKPVPAKAGIPAIDSFGGSLDCPQGLKARLRRTKKLSRKSLPRLSGANSSGRQNLRVLCVFCLAGLSTPVAKHVTPVIISPTTFVWFGRKPHCCRQGSARKSNKNRRRKRRERRLHSARPNGWSDTRPL